MATETSATATSVPSSIKITEATETSATATPLPSNIEIIKAAETSATITPLPSNIKIKEAPETSATRYELRITSLYLHARNSPDPNPSHETLLRPNGAIGFGATVANDYAIYDGPDPSRNTVIARAQGLHMRTGYSWSTTFNIVFETDPLKGSALQVMGVGIQDGDQLAILSGTGQFTMAQGFINKKPPSYVSDGTIIELDIYAVFQPTKVNLVTEAPKGGSGGQYREPKAVPYRLETIKIREGPVICSIEYTFLDRYGTKHTEGPWGGDSSPYVSIVKLGAEEYIKEVSGTIGKHNGIDVVASLKFVTNLRTLGPYGKPSGNPFTLPEKTGGSVVGFVARTAEFVNAIGVIVRP